jgi:hypothetical protein
MIDNNHTNIVFNITFHWQINQLKYHLENLFNWCISNKSEFVITSAHKQNLDDITKFCNEKYPNKKVHFCFIEKDQGYHIGTIVNVIESINYIDKNITYDYIVNIEADNMFYDESKLIFIISKMKEKDKHMILIEESRGRLPQNILGSHLQIPNWLHITTLNIYSNYFIKNFFPKEYYKEYMNLGWCGQPGTPFEAYLSLAFIKKHNLTNDDIQMKFWNTYGLRLEYDRNKKIFDGWYKPDDMVPDKFMRWGILNCPGTGGTPREGWEVAKQFIDLHKKLMYNPENYD